ncbi:AWPM-19-like family protein [Rhynchospora pubera]|uniref:AWPM-19-like family protein n=1 Tax=Rhynchospora pubera TaxID=906938 RepID=A0AAV8ED97_9POAL|nr:AWPM-19-like family protein [Rhynchospora pubera]KAJ4786363.1 AWPM-19-like family protein [Rhynchospora pubera]KAJ4804884.1 AWPM-19-like family protein [Rhynchospora pubera]
MATGGPHSAATFLLFVNLIMYAAAAVVAGWAINYSIDEAPSATLAPPARIFPIYFPIGNLATGFFVIFSLLAGIVGVMTSLTGLQEVMQARLPSILSAAASSVVTWALTLLAMGLACKEISIGPRPANLRALETLTIILSGTQLFCTGAIHAIAPSTLTGSSLIGRV